LTAAKALFSLDGRVALITGGSRGLGLAMAEGLGQAGATVAINGRNADTLETVATTLRGRGYCLWHETDVPSRRTCVIAARSTASAGADRRIAHHASLRLAADINRCSRGRKLTEIANFTPGQGMEQLKHGMGSRH